MQVQLYFKSNTYHKLFLLYTYVNYHILSEVDHNLPCKRLKMQDNFAVCFKNKEYISMENDINYNDRLEG